MIAQLARYTRHMVLLIIVGVLLILVSQMGSSPSAGFLGMGIAVTLLGVVLLVVTKLGGQKRQ
ncbi:hypothetical protein OG394_30030 [Kribbella sp. NBC_01245]|uniref:hypothetical protein n=1 Tax=Kribbella sp. NBC_01245 TaxID=2903578 RepID=UPI002E27DF6E|nr:hypothetical protein [Kribbella sp. NBC_01245]